MNEKEKDIVTGAVFKGAAITSQEVTEAELRKINKYTLKPLTAEEVFTFKTMIGDNELDDRNFMPFTKKALEDLKKQYIGTTVIKDHWRSADNQIARIYDTELTESDKLTGAGENHTELIGKCYMVRTSENAELIKEIEAGIKKEVSSSCRPKRMVCSICGEDNMKHYCIHFPGRTYETKEGKKATCMMTIDGSKEAYELSLVAVPAQPRAGTVKAFGDKAFFEDDLSLEDTKEQAEKAEIDSGELEIIKIKAFIENEQI